LILRGENSDLLSEVTAREMQSRGPAARAGRVQAVHVAGCGHAPALMDTAQIAIVRNFLFDASSASRAARVRQPRSVAVT